LRAADTSSFDAANVLYEQGQFAAAAAAYEGVIASGLQSSALLFNLGNAWFKAGHLGRAIAAYRQAARLTPRDPDLRANLAFAREQRRGPSLTSGWFARGSAHLTVDEWTLLACAAAWAWLLSWALLRLRPDWSSVLRKLTFTFLVAAVLLAVCLASVWRQSRAPAAVVVAAEVPVRHGPLEESQPAFTLYDGAEVEVLDRKDPWLQVSADGKQIGWLKSEHVLRF
jgi:tetratricopeptide (TPR) repeat protein